MNQKMGDIVVFTGNSNHELVDNICKEIGIEKGKCKVSTFSDGEIAIDIDISVRGLSLIHI